MHHKKRHHWTQLKTRIIFMCMSFSEIGIHFQANKPLSSFWMKCVPAESATMIKKTSFGKMQQLQKVQFCWKLAVVAGTLSAIRLVLRKAILAWHFWGCKPYWHQQSLLNGPFNQSKYESKSYGANVSLGIECLRDRHTQYLSFLVSYCII